MPLSKGLIQVNTGDGKGKTSAALGQALRSSGRGLDCLVQQFFKPASEPSGEQLAGSSLEFRRGDFRHPFFDKNADRGLIREKILAALDAIKAEWMARKWDLVVLDEVNNALRDGFVGQEEFCSFLDLKPAECELILTGRGAPAWLVERADYVTEFKKIKHPMDLGQAARSGIEF